MTTTLAMSFLPRRRAVLGFTLLGLMLPALALTQTATISISKTVTKSAARPAITSGDLTIEVAYTKQHILNDPAPVAPNGAPTFVLDLFDDDAGITFGNDCQGTTFPDRTQASAGVTGGWIGGGISEDQTGLPETLQRRDWIYRWTVPSFSVGTAAAPCDDWPFSGNPYMYVYVSSGPVINAEHRNDCTGAVGVPQLPSLGFADIGVTGPSNKANSSVLYGESIAGFSRGNDEISTLQTAAGSSGPALYMATERTTQTLVASHHVNPGTALVLNAAGETWDEEAYLHYVKSERFLGQVRFLNLNTAAPGGPIAGTDMFVVLAGSRQIRFTANSNLGLLSTYLDLTPYTSSAVSAIAVEDVGAPGVFDSGDLVLYSVVGSSAIHRLAFGGVPAFLTANGATFDGTTTLNLDHMDQNGVNDLMFELGHVTALSVASLAGSQATPSDRVAQDLGDVGAPVPGLLPIGLVALALACTIAARRTLRRRAA